MSSVTMNDPPAIVPNPPAEPWRAGVKGLMILSPSTEGLRMTGCVAKHQSLNLLLYSREIELY